MLRMLPRRSRSSGNAVFTVRKTPFRLTSTSRFQSVSEIDSKVFLRPDQPLFTRISSEPTSFSVSRTMARIESGCVMSTSSACVFAPNSSRRRSPKAAHFFASRLAMTSSAPSSAKAELISPPSRPAPPTTSAVRPFSEKSSEGVCGSALEEGIGDDEILRGIDVDDRVRGHDLRAHGAEEQSRRALGKPVGEEGVHGAVELIGRRELLARL